VLEYAINYYFKGTFMFEDNAILESLTDKVNELIKKYDEVCRINEELHNEIVTLKAQNEAKTNQIMRLEEDLDKKNSEADDVMKKIEAVLGR
jgi:hypothetical protein